jgi:hypothetical protein
MKTEVEYNGNADIVVYHAKPPFFSILGVIDRILIIGVLKNRFVERDNESCRNNTYWRFRISRLK